MTYPERPLLHLLTRTSLVGQIIVGLIAGLLLASFFPAAALKVGFIGKVFVSALKAVAPVLVFVLVMASIANHRQGQQTISGRSCCCTWSVPSAPRWWR